jgi:uroporphyrinogen III methyltransferase/synthase
VIRPAGRVCIIGAGPGDPGLITARGLRLLSEADVVVYDRGVDALLRWARPDAERLEVGAPAEQETAQDAISILLAEKAREGRMVARLKWGDAFVFDSGGKEALFLHEQGVPFEVVPGIPAAVGATAYAGIPVTYPGSADAVILLRGHEDQTDAPPDVDWSAVARMDATLLCYVGGRLAPTVLRTLLEHGVPPARGAALVFQGTLASQRTITGTVTELLELTDAGGHTSPGLLVIGDVANLRNHLRWFDERPLFGKRIVVTRSHEQARDLCEALEALGAQAIEAPTFKVAPAEDPEAIERAAASIGQFAWVIFESANAVARFLACVTRGSRDLRSLGGVSICAIGPSTAERLLASGLRPDVIIPEFRAEEVAEMVNAHRPITSERVLLVRPDHFRDLLAADLTRRGAIVTDLVAYRTISESADAPAAQHLYRLLLEGAVDAVLFASPTGVQRFAELMGREQAADLLNTTAVAAIGPVTAAAAEELGIKTTVMPTSYTVDGLVEALMDYFETATATLKN